jgi:hypothetical protein
MLRFLLEQGLSERKARLLACAACRHIWRLLPDERSRRAVEVAERFADGRASRVELAQARNDAMAANDRLHKATWAAYWTANARLSGAEGPLWNVFAGAADAAARHAAQQAATDQLARWEAAQDASLREQAEIVRELAGDPFRPAAMDARWLTWHGGLVTALAEGIYEDRGFDRLPILADALEDAGCHDDRLLAHLRSGKEHAPGCWALDAVLEKE